MRNVRLNNIEVDFVAFMINSPVVSGNLYCLLFLFHNNHDFVLVGKLQLVTWDTPFTLPSEVNALRKVQLAVSPTHRCIKELEHLFGW